MKFLWNILKWALLLFILGYGVLTVKGCYDTQQANKPPVMPDMGKVPYVLTIESTGQQILTARVDTKSSSEAGKLIYSLPQGFWELVKNRFVYRKTNLILDEHIWGTIKVSRRME